MSEFTDAFLTRCAMAGLSESQVKDRLSYISQEFGKEAADEIAQALEKQAWLGAVSSAAKYIPKVMKAPWTKFMSKIRPAAGMADNAVNAASRAAPQVNIRTAPRTPLYGQMTSTAARGLGGAYAGAHMGEANSDSYWDNVAGAMGGAAYGIGMPRMNHAFRTAGRRAFTGSMAGSGVGAGLEMLGVAPEGTAAQMGQIGGFGGLGTAFTPGLRRSLSRPGAPKNWATRAGRGVEDFLSSSGEFMPRQIHKNFMGPGANTAKRLGTVLGPGALATNLASQGVQSAIVEPQVAKTEANFEQRMRQKSPQMFAEALQNPQNQQMMRDMADQMIRQETGGVGLDEIGSVIKQNQQLFKDGKLDISQVLGPLANLPDMIFQQFPGGASLAALPPLAKWMILLGGGSLLGGLFSGNSGMQGLGAVMLGGGLLPMLGGISPQAQQAAVTPPAQSPAPITSVAPDPRQHGNSGVSPGRPTDNAPVIP